MSDAAELIQAVTEMEERARQVPELAKGIANRAAGYHDQVKAYLDRMPTDDVHDAVIVEAYELVEEGGEA